uniref:Uncharacterized protein n=1 Tax=Romanomermis culicivorax TaxID=13658 RepID=A0A915L131_ROMCU
MTPIDKLQLEDEPLLPAVDAVYCAIEQASQIAQPVPAIAALPPMTRTSVQTLSVIAQQQPLAAATDSPTVATNAFGEMLHAVNYNISIIETSPFPSATTPWSPKIGVLFEIHPCGAWSSTSLGRSRYRPTATMKNNAARQAETLDQITPCFLVLVDAKETPALLDTGCPGIIISQRLHKALIKESPKAVMAFQQHHDVNPLMSINAQVLLLYGYFIQNDRRSENKKK